MKPLHSMPVSWQESPPDLDAVQTWEISSLENAKESGYISVLVQASMGTGKTVLAAKWAKKIESLGRRMVFLAHLDTLIEQAERTFSAWGVETQVEHGKRKAKHYFGRAPHVIASKDSLYPRRMEDFIHRTRLDQCEVDVVFDEAHLVVSESFLSPCRALRPVFTFGLSGTPWRLDGRPLVGQGAPFEALACRYDFLTGCRHRNLVSPRFLECVGSIDLRDIKVKRQVQGMDYDLAQLVERINENLGHVCRAAGEQMDLWGLTRTLGFFPDVNTARNAEAMFRGLGYRVRSIYGDMRQSDRDEVKDAYHRGNLDILTSCQMLDVGFDDPPTDGIILATPTKSPVKALQQGGRGSRLFPGKDRYSVIGYRWETDDEGPQSTLDLLLRGVPDPDVRRLAGIALRKRPGVDFLEAVEQAEIDRAEELAEQRRLREQLPIACVDRPADYTLKVYDPLALGSAVLDRDDVRLLKKCGLEAKEIASMTKVQAAGFLEKWWHLRPEGKATFRQVERLVKSAKMPREEAMSLTWQQARGLIYSLRKRYRG